MEVLGHVVQVHRQDEEVWSQVFQVLHLVAIDPQFPLNPICRGLFERN